MLRRLTLLLIVVAFTFGSAYAGWHPYGERYAIIVMGGHEDPGSQLYRWYWGDTGGMYRELISYGFAGENIQFLSYGDSANAHPDWVDGTSTIANVRAAYNWAQSQCSAEDLLYIYWVDHGSRTSFLLYDGNITHAELGTLMQPIGAKQIIGAYNPCYSGAVIDDISRIGVITVTSQDPDHPNSWGWAGQWRKALRGGSPEDPTDTNGDGYISMTEAYIWIAPKSQQAGEHSMYDDNGDGVGSEWGQPRFDPDDPTKDGYIGKFYSLDGWSGAVELACEPLTAVFCRGKNFYFQVTTVNNTGNPINVTMTFTGWPGFDCDSTYLLVVIPRNKDIPVGTDTTNYFFKVPSSVAPGDYSASVSFEYNQETHFCCMNATIVQCGPWKSGGNTEWDVVEIDLPEFESSLPASTSLSQSYPNPFNASTSICFSLARDSDVSLKVYDLTARLIETLFDGYQEAGEHVVNWDASEVSSGLYFYKLTAANFTETRRMMLVK